MDKVSLEIRYTVDDFVRGHTYIQNRSFFSRYGFIIVPILILSVVLLLFLLNGAALRKLGLSDVLLILVPLVITSFVLLLLKYYPHPLLKWNIARQLKSSPLLAELQRLEFDETGIRGETSLSEATTRWDAIIEFAETREDLFFFTSKKYAMIVPKSKMSLEQLDKIKELATVKLRERAKFWNN